jgi:hypothetical protein
MPVGHEIALALREDIRNAWFLDKIQLPQADLSKMTAFAVRRLLEEQVRAQAPLFEPIEPEYSAPICNETFELLRDGGAFGPPEDMPATLRTADVNFTFQSPLRDIADATKTQKFVEGLQLTEQATAFDPAAKAALKVAKGLTDALRGIGIDQDWLGTDAEIAAAQQQLAQQQKMQAGAGALAVGADVAGKAAKAAADLQQAGL